MVKVRHSTPEEEAEFSNMEIDEEKIRDASAEPEEFRKAISGKEIVISDQVRQELEAMGMSEDEFVAMFLKSANATN